MPFLDHRFVELALVDPDERSRRTAATLKHILKKAVRGVIPDELIDRPKQGFGVPVYEWLLRRARRSRRAHELDAFCAKTDSSTRGGVPGCVERSRGREAWYLLNLALWWKEFVAA